MIKTTTTTETLKRQLAQYEANGHADHPDALWIRNELRRRGAQ